MWKWTYAPFVRLRTCSCAATSSSAGAAFKHANPVSSVPLEVELDSELELGEQPRSERIRSSGSCHDDEVGPIGAVDWAPDCMICFLFVQYQCVPLAVRFVSGREWWS